MWASATSVLKPLTVKSLRPDNRCDRHREKCDLSAQRQTFELVEDYFSLLNIAL
jgi:hypothetical protein